jgi:DNA-binding NarL/FixJ family response regulator
MKNIRVLIVDDLPQVRQGLQSMLELAARRAHPGFELVGEADNGEMALQQAQSLKPDVILMDLEMPGMDGYEATRRIKAELPAARVIILSIHAGEEERRRARSAGADAFIVKGADVKTLVEVLQAKNPSPPTPPPPVEGSELL